MTDEEIIRENHAEIRRLRAVVRELQEERDKALREKADRLLEQIFEMLPKKPRSADVHNDPGFWTDGDQILCPSEVEAEAVANFLQDVVSEHAGITATTGYYDPEEDKKEDLDDEYTGFYYVDF